MGDGRSAGVIVIYMGRWVSRGRDGRSAGVIVIYMGRWVSRGRDGWGARVMGRCKRR